MPPRRKAGPVEASVVADLASLEKDVSKSSFAQVALSMAREIDDPSVSVNQRVAAARVLVDTLVRLGVEESSEPAEPTPLELIRGKRADRRGVAS